MLRAEARRAPGTPVVAARALTALTALALLVAGCGDEEPDGGVDTAGGTELTVTLDPDGPRGEKPRPSRRAVRRARTDRPAPGSHRLVAPVPPATACTEIYGGPDEVTLEGTIGGEPVDATFTRANGCEIDRFDRITPLLKELFPDYRPGASLAP